LGGIIDLTSASDQETVGNRYVATAKTISSSQNGWRRVVNWWRSAAPWWRRDPCPSRHG